MTERRSATRKSGGGFTDEERSALQERARELKTSARRAARPDSADVEREVLAKIAELPDADRARGERIHALIRAHAPQLTPRLWYGMPAYARDGTVICFFQSAQKFKTRYATLGFSDKAHLDDGNLWPTAYALTSLTSADEARIAELIKRAVS